MSKKKNWFKMETKDDGTADIYILDYIGWYGVEPETFIKELKEVADADEINLYINSPGGSVFDGLAIYNALKEYKDKLYVHVTGYAASMASVIMLAGSKRKVYKGSFVMIHHPWVYTSGNAKELRKKAENLDKISDEMIDIYSKETSLTKDEINDYMSEETWFKSSEAVEYGFATEEDTEEEAALMPLDKMVASTYKNMPKNIKLNNPTIRDAEESLKNIGFSNTQAKGILAKGFRDGNDEENEKNNEEFLSELDSIINIF